MIRFNAPALVGRELEFVAEAAAAGRTGSSGPFSVRCRQLLAWIHSAPEALLTASGADALEATALLLGLGPGDTVIVPSFASTSTASAYARHGATVRFADIEPRTFGIDPVSVEGLIDDTVRAVVCVHYGGVPCDVDGLLQVLDRHPGIALVEDNAHGFFGTHDGRSLGTFGRFSTLSFHETKNFQCGEGGALIVNDEADVDRARTLFDAGTGPRASMLDGVEGRPPEDKERSFGMSDLLAAYLYGQLEQCHSVLTERGRVEARYRELFAPHAELFGYELPVVPATCTSAHHMFHLLMPDRQTRDRVLREAPPRGVEPTSHYVPLHSSAVGRRGTDVVVECPVTDDVSGRLVRMPYHTQMSDDDVVAVSEVVLDVLAAQPSPRSAEQVPPLRRT
jgi:dTDP-4-amino-4,6-dideoxygalactose transaminase